MKIIAATIAALASVAVATPAHATRPIVGFHYADVCKNIKGAQPIYTVLGPGPYDFNADTKRKKDCIRVTKG